MDEIAAEFDLILSPDGCRPGENDAAIGDTRDRDGENGRLDGERILLGGSAAGGIHGLHGKGARTGLRGRSAQYSTAAQRNTRRQRTADNCPSVRGCAAVCA